MAFERNIGVRGEPHGTEDHNAGAEWLCAWMLKRVGKAALLPLAFGVPFGIVFAGESVLSQNPAAMNVVTYESFGARGDGKTDDLPAIVEAHAYANEHRLPVRARDDATYYIGGRNLTAIIQTDTDFGTARFIIDDTAVENVRSWVFEVRSSHRPTALVSVRRLKRGQVTIGVTLPQPCLVIVTDKNTRRFIRRGPNQNRGSFQTDVFLVEKDGRVDPSTPIIWDFDQITEIQALPLDEVPLRLSGGRFVTIANAAESKYTYYSRGIAIRRSNVVVEGLEHHVRGEGDHGAPYHGFLNIAECAHVKVRNVILTGRKTYRTIGSAGSPVSMGSYDISLNRAVDISFENCRQTNDILDRRFWGIMGSNFCKNLLYDSCTLSRFDAHQGVYNPTIRNSTLGYMGINLIGGGLAVIENTAVRARSFVNLRPDYGSTWNGEIHIRNCTFAPQGMADGIHLIGGSNDGQHDFGYVCTMPERIVIVGLRIEDTNHSEKYKGPNIFADFNPRLKDESYRQPFPYTVTREVILKDVTTASGKPLRLSDNAFMFKNVVVRRE
ncbi:MAG: hypothetical protein ACUVWX_09865 [Kiritimatiellia bacterium]